MENEFQPATKSLTVAKSSDLATAETPFIRNAWYVIALGTEITRAPLARSVLGRSIVLFRSEGGQPVALRNRCAHRSFPLSNGRVEGDTLVCGYHGLRYDLSGKCIEIPMQKVVPAAVCVHAYPLKEHVGFIWIWMGDATLANDQPVPYQPWMDGTDWERREAYLFVQGSYVHLHENLLDLSHLSYLHSSTFGTPEYARAPVETKIHGEDIQVWRTVECVLPPIYAKPLGWEGARALRKSGSQFVTPALHVNTGIFENREGPPDTFQPSVKVGQFITPETSYSTYYWTVLARNFALGDEAMGEFMLQQQLAAFREDKFAMEEINRLALFENDSAFAEVSIPTDRAGVLMRRHLKKLSDSELGMA